MNTQDTTKFDLDMSLIFILSHIDIVPYDIKIKFNRHQRRRIIKSISIHGSKLHNVKGHKKRKQFKTIKLMNYGTRINMEQYFGEEASNKVLHEQKYFQTFHDDIIKKIKKNRLLTCMQFQVVCNLVRNDINEKQPTKNEQKIVHLLAEAGKSLYDLEKLDEISLRKWIGNQATRITQIHQQDSFQEPKIRQKTAAAESCKPRSMTQFDLDYMFIHIFSNIDPVPYKIKIKFNSYQVDRTVKILSTLDNVSAKAKPDGSNKKEQRETLYNQEKTHLLYNTIIKKINDNQSLTCEQFQGLCNAIIKSNINKENATPNEKNIIHLISMAGCVLYDLNKLSLDELDKWIKQKHSEILNRNIKEAFDNYLKKP